MSSIDGPVPTPTITLNDGRHIPQLGFGVYQVPPEDTAATDSEQQSLFDELVRQAQPG
jgi:diketogulonate reductase-like aldo/keto reductase